MREIKFRAIFEDENGYFIEYFSLEHLADGYILGTGLKIEDAITIEEYTGLKDKNGKEIYEGDIVKIEGKIFVNQERVDYTLHKVQHGYEKWAPAFYLIGIDSFTEDNKPSVNLLGYKWAKDCKVIGNIYE